MDYQVSHPSFSKMPNEYNWQVKRSRTCTSSSMTWSPSRRSKPERSRSLKKEKSSVQSMWMSFLPSAHLSRCRSSPLYTIRPHIPTCARSSFKILIQIWEAGSCLAFLLLLLFWTTSSFHHDGWFPEDEDVQAGSGSAGHWRSGHAPIAKWMHFSSFSAWNTLGNTLTPPSIPLFFFRFLTTGGPWPHPLYLTRNFTTNYFLFFFFWLFFFIIILFFFIVICHLHRILEEVWPWGFGDVNIDIL